MESKPQTRGSWQHSSKSTTNFTVIPKSPLKFLVDWEEVLTEHDQLVDAIGAGDVKTVSRNSSQAHGRRSKRAPQNPLISQDALTRGFSICIGPVHCDYFACSVAKNICVKPLTNKFCTAGKLEQPARFSPRLMAALYAAPADSAM